jgi:hypothetical protein
VQMVAQQLSVPGPSMITYGAIKLPLERRPVQSDFEPEIIIRPTREMLARHFRRHERMQRRLHQRLFNCGVRGRIPLRRPSVTQDRAVGRVDKALVRVGERWLRADPVVGDRLVGGQHEGVALAGFDTVSLRMDHGREGGNYRRSGSSRR